MFSQRKEMISILEKAIGEYGGFKTIRMDGDTPMQKRQGLVDEFNSNEEIDVFLLTTQVGGLGINLTGADRVIIFDPDWNPANDIQVSFHSAFQTSNLLSSQNP